MNIHRSAARVAALAMLAASAGCAPEGGASRGSHLTMDEATAVSCPAPVTIECASPSGTPATLTAHVSDAEGDALTVTWKVGGAVVKTDSIPQGPAPTSKDVSLTQAFAKGTNAVEITVSDRQGEASCTTSVTVADTRPPVVTCAFAQPMLWPPNGDLVNAGLQSAAVDACEGALPVHLRVFSDEGDLQSGFSPDAKDVGPETLRLRSERDARLDGRVYLVTSRATDSSGNVGAACCTATVPHDQSPASIASAAAQAAQATANCPVRPADYLPVGDGPAIGPKQ